MLPADAVRLLALSLAMCVASEGHMLGWLAGLDPLQASTLFVAGFAGVTACLSLPWVARAGVLGMAAATVSWPASDALYYAAGTVVQVAMVAGWSVEAWRHQRWLSRGLATSAFVVSAAMLLLVWIPGRLLGILPMATDAAGWLWVVGPGISSTVAIVFAVVQCCQGLRWIERSV